MFILHLWITNHSINDFLQDYLFINQVIIDHLYYLYKCCISFSHFIYLIVFNHNFIIICNFDKDKQKKVDGFYDICFIVLFVFWDFIEPANPKKAWLFNLVCYKDHWLTLTFFFFFLPACFSLLIPLCWVMEQGSCLFELNLFNKTFYFENCSVWQFHLNWSFIIHLQICTQLRQNDQFIQNTREPEKQRTGFKWNLRRKLNNWRY